MSYEMLLSLLAAIQNSTYDTKYIIETTPSIKFDVKIFDRIAWTFDMCIAAWPYLRSVLTIDTGFLSGRYAGKLFIARSYDAEQQLLPLAFVVVVGRKVWQTGVGSCSGCVKRLSVLVKLLLSHINI
jgi:hypothetical protein